MGMEKCGLCTSVVFNGSHVALSQHADLFIHNSIFNTAQAQSSLNPFMTLLILFCPSM